MTTACHSRCRARARSPRAAARECAREAKRRAQAHYAAHLKPGAHRCALEARQAAQAAAQRAAETARRTARGTLDRAATRVPGPDRLSRWMLHTTVVLVPIVAALATAGELGVASIAALQGATTPTLTWLAGDPIVESGVAGAVPAAMTAVGLVTLVFLSVLPVRLFKRLGLLGLVAWASFGTAEAFEAAAREPHPAMWGVVLASGLVACCAFVRLRKGWSRRVRTRVVVQTPPAAGAGAAAPQGEAVAA